MLNEAWKDVSDNGQKIFVLWRLLLPKVIAGLPVVGKEVRPWCFGCVFCLDGAFNCEFSEEKAPLDKQMVELNHVLLPLTFRWKMFPGNQALALWRCLWKAAGKEVGEDFRRVILLFGVWLSASLS